MALAPHRWGRPARRRTAPGRGAARSPRGPASSREGSSERSAFQSLCMRCSGSLERSLAPGQGRMPPRSVSRKSGRPQPGAEAAQYFCAPPDQRQHSASPRARSMSRADGQARRSRLCPTWHDRARLWMARHVRGSESTPPVVWRAFLPARRRTSRWIVRAGGLAFYGQLSATAPIRQAASRYPKPRKRRKALSRLPLGHDLEIDGRFRARGAAGFGPPPSANRCRNRGRRTQTSGSEANARPECRCGEPLDDRLPDAMLPETVGRCGIATRNTGEFRNAGIKVVDHWTGS